MTGIKILAETKKALRIDAEGVQTWIQRRWMRADGTLTPKGAESVAKAAAEKAAEAAGVDRWANRAKSMAEGVDVPEKLLEDLEARAAG